MLCPSAKLFASLSIAQLRLRNLRALFRLPIPHLVLCTPVDRDGKLFALLSDLVEFTYLNFSPSLGTMYLNQADAVTHKQDDRQFTTKACTSVDGEPINIFIIVIITKAELKG